MTPFERVHQLIISGKVIGPDGSWVSRAEALKEKRALLQHVLGGEVSIGGTWTRLSDIATRTATVARTEYRDVPEPLPPPQPVRHEYEKETAVMPPPRFNRERILRELENVNARFAEPTLPPPLQTAPEPPVAAVTDIGTDIGHPPLPPVQPSTLQKAATPSSLLHQYPETGDAITQPPGQPSETVTPVVNQEQTGTTWDPPVLPLETNLRAQPTPQSAPESAPSRPSPPPKTSPIQKLDMAARDRASGTDAVVNNESVTIRTIPLGKQSSLTISETRAGTTPVAVCSVEGFIDQSNSDTFHHQLMSMLEFGVRYFIIAFDRTVLIGSAGWGVLAVAARMIKVSGGRLLVCAMKPEIEESFHLLQFDDVIDARKTLAECIESMRSSIESQQAAAPPSGADAAADSRYGESFAELPLPEKIRTIISRSGPLSLFQIAAHLKQDQYGKEKIGLVKLHFLLKDLNLDTNWKRVRYYRSC